MPLAANVRISFKDGKNKASFTKIRIPASLAVAEFVGFAVAAAQVLLNLSTCRITKVGVYVGVDLSSFTIKAAPALLSDVEQKAQFIFDTAETGFSARCIIPAINENISFSTSDIIDTADAQVIAFVTMMETGAGSLSPAKACDSRGNDITALRSTRELFQRR